MSYEVNERDPKFIQWLKQDWYAYRIARYLAIHGEYTTGCLFMFILPILTTLISWFGYGNSKIEWIFLSFVLSSGGWFIIGSILCRCNKFWRDLDDNGYFKYFTNE